MPKNKKLTSNTMAKLRALLCTDLDDVENRMALARLVDRQGRKHLSFLVDYISSQHPQCGQEIKMDSLYEFRRIMVKHSRWLRSTRPVPSWRLDSQHKKFCLLDLKNGKLQRTSFHKSIFLNCRFTKCSFNFTTMNSCSFQGVHFVKCHFTSSKMKRCLFKDCTFEDCVIEHSDFYEAGFEECLFENTSLAWTDFALVEFKDCAGHEEPMKLATNHELAENWSMRGFDD